jgi:hypothetical protein
VRLGGWADLLLTNGRRPRGARRRLTYPLTNGTHKPQVSVSMLAILAKLLSISAKVGCKTAQGVDEWFSLI